MCIHNAGTIRATVVRNNGWDTVFFDITDWESFRVVFGGIKSNSNMIQTFKMAHVILPVVIQQL